LNKIHFIPDIEGQHIGKKLAFLEQALGLVGSTVCEAGLRRSLLFLLFRNAYM